MKPRKVPFRSAPARADGIAAADVLRGRPRSRTFILAEARGGYACGIWHCTPGRFRWSFGVDEFVYLLAGVFRVEWPDGSSITVRRGEAAYFPKGRCVCTVTRTVKKVFVARG